MSDLQHTIEAAWDARDTIGFGTTGAVRDAARTAEAKGWPPIAEW